MIPVWPNFEQTLRTEHNYTFKRGTNQDKAQMLTTMQADIHTQNSTELRAQKPSRCAYGRMDPFSKHAKTLLSLKTHLRGMWFHDSIFSVLFKYISTILTCVLGDVSLAIWARGHEGSWRSCYLLTQALENDSRNLPDHLTAQSKYSSLWSRQGTRAAEGTLVTSYHHSTPESAWRTTSSEWGDFTRHLVPLHCHKLWKRRQKSSLGCQ